MTTKLDRNKMNDKYNEFMKRLKDYSIMAIEAMSQGGNNTIVVNELFRDDMLACYAILSIRR